MSRSRRRWSAGEVLDLVLDAGSFVSWDTPVDLGVHSPDYQRVLREAAARAGTDESVLTGSGSVRGRPVAVLVSEFGFLGGSIGRAAAQRIITAVRRATAERLPLLASTSSGGTRMQEGTPAFVEMAEISRAIALHRAAGLPYLVHLRHPTTGGVYASWGSLGHLTVAEPGALIGFLGPKVYEALRGEPFPPGVQEAEHLAAKGVIDAVVGVEDLAAVVDRTLAVLLDPPGRGRLARRGQAAVAADAWEAVELTRRTDRVGVRDLLRHGATGTVPLSGTDQGERDDAVLVALTRLDGQPCVLVGQDRERQTDEGAMGPAALRVARRGMRLAEELGLPLVTVIDTPGAELSVAAEEGAVAGEIARCIATLTTMTVPTLAVLLGQGCGGGALALLPARRVIAAQHAWLTPLPPEGASAIVHGHTACAAEMARAQEIRAVDLAARGTVHAVVAEHADDDRAALARAVVAECAVELARMRLARPGRLSACTSGPASDPAVVSP